MSKRCATNGKGREMPTDKPRLNVTFEPYTYALLERLHELDGTPKGRIVSEIVESARPFLEAMVKAAEEFRASSKESQAALIAALEESEKQIMPDVRRLQARALRAFEGGSGSR